MHRRREINLLPPQLLALRVNRIYLNRIGRLLRGTIGGLGLLVIVLGAAYGVAIVTQHIATPPMSVTTEEQGMVQAEINRVNTELAAIKRWRSQHEAWTPLLPDVFAALPPDVRLSVLSVDEGADTLTVRGTFTSRDTIVLLQRRLEDLSWVTSLDAPLSNFQTGAQTEFSFTLYR